MRISTVLLLLSCLAASPARAWSSATAPRAARLLPLESPATGGGPSLEAPGRPSKVVQGLLVTAATGLLAPVVLFPLVWAGPRDFYGLSNTGLLLYGTAVVGCAGILAPLLVHWVMEGAPHHGRVALGALLGAAGGLGLGLLLSPATGGFSFVLALLGPGLGAVVAIETARQAGLYDGAQSRDDDDARLGGWNRPSPAVAFRF